MKVKYNTVLLIIAMLFVLLLGSSSIGPARAAGATLEALRIYIPVMDKNAAVISTTGASTTSNAGSSSSSSSGSSSSSSASYAPQPGDSSLVRDKVFLNLAASKLLITSFRPILVEAILVGNLPDPCHVLRIVVSPPDLNNIIKLDVYSLVKPGTACITVLKPFTVSVPLGSFSPGQYTVLVDGSRLGVFNTTAPVTTP